MNGIEQIFERFCTGVIYNQFFHEDTINKLKKYDCKRYLSPMLLKVLKGNQMEIISLVFVKILLISRAFDKTRVKLFHNFTRHH